MRLALLSLTLFVLSSPAFSHAQEEMYPCAPAIEVTTSPADFFRSFGAFALMHGASLNAALKIIDSGSLISSWQAGKGEGVFSSDKISESIPDGPLRSIFLEAVARASDVKPKVEEIKEFEVALLISPNILNDYPFYAKPTWSYDRYAHCISRDVKKQNGSIRHMFEKLERSGGKDRNELLFSSGKGLPLQYLVGIYAPERMRRKLREALIAKGLTRERAESLLNFPKLVEPPQPIPEITREKMTAVCNSVKGNKIYMEDLLGEQPYLQMDSWEPAIRDKSLPELQNWLLGKELVVRAPLRYRRHIKVDSFSSKDGYIYISGLVQDSPKHERETYYVTELRQVGFLDQGVDRSRFCRGVFQE